MKEFILAFQNYRDYQGFTQRKAYWLFILIGHIIYPMIIFLTINQIFLGFGLSYIQYPIRYYEILSSLLNPLFLIYFIVLAAATFSIQTRRLNDAGFSKWYLILLLIPPVGILVLFILSTLKSKQKPETQVSSNISSPLPSVYRSLTGFLIGLIFLSISAPLIWFILKSYIETMDSFKGENTNPITGLGMGLLSGVSILVGNGLSFLLGCTVGYRLIHKYFIDKYLFQ